MRNYDLSPLLRQWIGFDKLANALQSKAPPSNRHFRRTTSKKATITTIASPLRWPGSARKIWISSLKARA